MFNQTTTVTGLQTTTINIPVTDVITVQGTLELRNIVPSATQGSGGGAGTGTGGGPQITSQVVATVKHNGSTILTTNAGDRGFIVNGVPCASGDTITVALSSSLKSDNESQAVKLTLAVTEGQV